MIRMDKPFWEATYKNLDVPTFSKRATVDVGELPAQYSGWEIIHHLEGTFSDTHPGGIHHEHAYERIIAKKL
jgi:hypothetical protein